jgi:hypothetical protein
MMGMWFIFSDPYLVMMVLLRNQNTNDEEEVGSGLYSGEEEEMEEDDEIYSDDANKHYISAVLNGNNTSLWFLPFLPRIISVVSLGFSRTSLRFSEIIFGFFNRLSNWTCEMR